MSEAAIPRPPAAEELRDLARLVRGLVPDRRDPEAFHVAKDEAAKRIAALARRIEREAA